MLSVEEEQSCWDEGDVKILHIYRHTVCIHTVDLSHESKLLIGFLQLENMHKDMDGHRMRVLVFNSDVIAKDILALNSRSSLELISSLNN